LAISFFLFNLLGYCAVNSKTVNIIDKKILIYINYYASQHSTTIPLFITNFGDIFYLFLLYLIAIAVLSFYKHYKDALLLTFIIGSAAISINLIKNIYYRLRPTLEYKIDYVSGLSYPSGHSFISMCFYGTLIYFIFKYIKNKKKKYLLSALLCSFIIIIGLSRIYLGVHYPSDILGGFSLGLFWISLWISIFKYSKNQKCISVFI
jgi:undecaprenyl-diphosphatase